MTKRPVVQETFTGPQKEHLKTIYAQCLEQGATPRQLAPLGSLIWIDWRRRLTAREIERGKELARRYDLLDKEARP